MMTFEAVSFKAVDYKVIRIAYSEKEEQELFKKLESVGIKVTKVPAKSVP